MKHLLTFTLAACLLYSCSTVKEVGQNPQSTSEVPTAEIEQFMQSRADSLISFTAEGTVVRSLNGNKQTGRFEMSLLRTDSLLLSLFGPFNVPVGKLQASPEYFQYYDALHDVAYEGRPEPQNMEKILQVPLSQNDMALLMRGEIPGGLTGFEAKTDDEGNTMYYRQRDTTLERVGINGQTKALTEYSLKKIEGETIISVRYSEFDEQSNIPMARRVSFLFPAADMALFLRYDDIYINKALDSYVFKIPAGTKRSRF